MSDVADPNPAGPPSCAGAAIIPFPGDRRGTAGTMSASGFGQILLFTGVRYERVPDTEALQTPRRGAPRPGRAAPAQRRQPS